jgi:hypothetical protein
MKHAHYRLGMACSMGRALRLCLPLVLAGLLTAPAAGQQVVEKPSISTIELVAPRVRQGVWNQLFGKAINPSGTDLSCQVIYPTDDPKLGIVRYGRNIWLPPHSETTLWVSIRPGMLLGEKAGAKGDFSVATQAIELMNAKTGMMLDRKGDQRFIIAGQSIKLMCYIDDPVNIELMPNDDYAYLKDAEAYLYTVSTVAMGRMPDQWYGYSGVNAVLVGYLDTAVRGRRPSQIQALLDWVSQGGVAIVFCTEKLPQMLTGPMGRAARVACGGMGQVRELAVRSADGKFKADVTLDNPTPYADLIPDGADVVCRANGLPLLTRARFGQGHVFVLATPVGTLGKKFPDPSAPTDPNKTISPLHPAWQTVGEAMVFTPAIRTEPFIDPMRIDTPKGGEDANLVPNKLAAISGRRGTDRWVVLMLLGGFVLATAGIGLAMRLMRYGERTWLFMLPVALVMSLAVYFYAETRKVNSSLSYVGMALASGDGRAIVYQATGFYSPTQYATTVSAGSPQGWLMPLSKKGNPLDKTELRNANGMIWPDMVVQRDSAKTFLAGAAIDFAGVDFKAAFGPTGLTGTLTNRTGQDVRDAVLMIRGRAFGVGELPADKPTEVSLGTQQRLGQHSFIPVGFMKTEDRWRNELVTGLTESKSIAAGGMVDDEPYLLGWVDKPVLSPNKDMTAPGKPSKGLMLVAQRVSFSPTAPGTPVLIPDEMLVKDYKPVGMALWARKTGFTTSPRAGAIDVQVTPPPSVGHLTGAKATMQITLGASGWKLNVQGIRPDGSFQLLESFDDPTGSKTIQIDQADAFTTDGVLRIRVAVESLTAGAPAARTPTGNQWKFDDIDVTLQGTVQ